MSFLDCNFASFHVQVSFLSIFGPYPWFLDYPLVDAMMFIMQIIYFIIPIYILFCCYKSQWQGQKGSKRFRSAVLDLMLFTIFAKNLHNICLTESQIDLWRPLWSASWKVHCVKSVRIWSFSGLYPGKYGNARKYGTENLRIRTFLTHW